MRYWHPFTEETVQHVIGYQPDKVLLLPLYPQFSTATSASSLNCWSETAFKMGLNVPTRIVGCHHASKGFIRANSKLLHNAL